MVGKALRNIIVIMIIVIMMFIDRSEEMNALQKRYNSDGFDFMVIYGRRRIGKTELIKQFCELLPAEAGSFYAHPRF